MGSSLPSWQDCNVAVRLRPFGREKLPNKIIERNDVSSVLDSLVVGVAMRGKTIFLSGREHVPDWQPRILLGMVEARSVNVKNTTTTTQQQQPRSSVPEACTFIFPAAIDKSSFRRAAFTAKYALYFPP